MFLHWLIKLPCLFVVGCSMFLSFYKGWPRRKADGTMVEDNASQVFCFLQAMPFLYILLH